MINEDEVQFEISDFGVGFNFCRYKEPSLDQIIKEKKKGGVGLILVKRIMDNMEFFRKSNRNVYRLSEKTKYRLSSPTPSINTFWQFPILLISEKLVKIATNFLPVQ